jgi:hypothetical protein
MTEKEAWGFIREAFRDKNLVERPSGVFYVKSYGKHWSDYVLGMCDLLHDLQKSKQINQETFDTMLNKIKQAVVHKKKVNYTTAWAFFLYPNTRYGARKRREFCTKMIRDLTAKK